MQKVEVVRSIEDCEPNTEGCTYARVVFPRVAGIESSAAERINTAIVMLVSASAFAEGPHADPGALGDEILAEYRAFREEFPDMDIPWALDRTGEVVHEGDGVISVAVDDYLYLGGAHPNSALTYRVFDAATGARLTLTDVIEEASIAELTRRAEVAFRSALDVAADESLEEAGFWFVDDVFAINDNWAIVAAGVAFHFDPYEVAAYAFGPSDFIVPRDRLRDLVRSDGPLASLRPVDDP